MEICKVSPTSHLVKNRTTINRHVVHRLGGEHRDLMRLAQWQEGGQTNEEWGVPGGWRTRPKADEERRRKDQERKKRMQGQGALITNPKL